MRIALYARVSKALEQHPENQLIELRKWIQYAGHEAEGEYIDEISSKDVRPNKELILNKIRSGQIDGVAFVALDRWGRTMSELVLELEEFSKTNKVFVSVKENIDLSTSAGRMYANMIAAFANFERDRISERSKAGVARAKLIGKIRGRHPKDCGCGQKNHTGFVIPIKNNEGQIISWKYPDGRILPVNAFRKIQSVDCQNILPEQTEGNNIVSDVKQTYKIISSP